MESPLPRPGTDVHLVIRNHSAYHRAKPTWSLRATVIDTLWWEKTAGTFCVLLPNDEIPVRVIHMRDVVTINGQMVEGWHRSPEKAKKWQVESNSFRDLFYIVSFDGQQWECTCRGFAFHKHCTHIRQVQHEQSCAM